MPVDNLVTYEEWFHTKDGIQLYTKTWKSAREPPIATVVFSHGFGEHINRYNHVFDKFQLKNIEVYAFDQRGFGQTGKRNKKPGVTGGWKVAMDDVTEALIRKRRKGVPQFLFGHSMGGGIVLNYACEGPERGNLAGIVASAPWILQSVQTKPAPPVLTIGSALSKVLPSLTIPVGVNAKYISRDPEEVQKYIDDPLIHGTGSLRSLSELLQGTKSVLKEKNKNIKGPIYICHGSDDPVTCPNASRQLFEKISAKDKTYREWPGLYHEMHNDFERDQVIGEWIQWILDHVNLPKDNYAKGRQTTQLIQSSMNLGLASA